MKAIKANKKSKGSTIPVTAQDHLDCGVSDEDHGDRWIGSGDVAKALRFYQKANGFYRKAIALDNGQTWISKDSIYNIARMQYMIFTKVVKNGLLPEISPYLDPEIDPSVSVIVDNISTVVNTHEQALNVLQPTANTSIDLLYNYGQVLVEAGEETEQPEWLVRGAEIFDKVLSLQIEKFTLPESNSSDPTENEIDSDDEEDINDSKPTASTILDTQLSFLHCLTHLIEFARDEKCSENILFQIEAAKSKAAELKTQIIDLITRFYNPSGEVSILPNELVEESLVSIAKYESSLAKTLEDLISIWSDENLPLTPHRYLSQADTYLDMQELIPSKSSEETTNLILWKSYSLAASILSKIIQPPNTPIIIKRRILLVRGDIDWLRSKLNTPAAIKNQDVLSRNANVYYQNCINVPSLANDLENELVVREATVKKQLLDGISPSSIQVLSLDRILHDIKQQGLL